MRARAPAKSARDLRLGRAGARPAGVSNRSAPLGPPRVVPARGVCATARPARDLLARPAGLPARSSCARCHGRGIQSDAEFNRVYQMAGWTQPLRPVCTLPRREVALAAMRIGGDDIAVKVATPLRVAA